MGVREAQRRNTERRLAETAFSLALEKGVDGFTIDDIVTSAGYCRRTFANHFSCKEEAIASVVLQYDRDANQVLDGLDDTTPLVDALHAVMMQQFTADMLDKLRAVYSLSRRYPSVKPYVLGTLEEMRHRALRSLRAWDGGDDRHPALYLPLLFGAVYGAASAVLEGQVDVVLKPSHDHSAMAYEEFVDLVFHYVRTGF
jgi:AcrR family transcriptional regulator